MVSRAERGENYVKSVRSNLSQAMCRFGPVIVTVGVGRGLGGWVGSGGGRFRAASRERPGTERCRPPRRSSRGGGEASPNALAFLLADDLYDCCHTVPTTAIRENKYSTIIMSNFITSTQWCSEVLIYATPTWVMNQHTRFLRLISNRIHISVSVASAVLWSNFSS